MTVALVAQPCLDASDDDAMEEDCRKCSTSITRKRQGLTSPASPKLIIGRFGCLAGGHTVPHAEHISLLWAAQHAARFWKDDASDLCFLKDCQLVVDMPFWSGCLARSLVGMCASLARSCGTIPSVAFFFGCAWRSRRMLWKAWRGERTQPSFQCRSLKRCVLSAPPTRNGRTMPSQQQNITDWMFQSVASCRSAHPLIAHRGNLQSLFLSPEPTQRRRTDTVDTSCEAIVRKVSEKSKRRLLKWCKAHGHFMLTSLP